MIVNGDQAGDFFGVTSRTVQNWVKDQNAPKIGHGKYNLKELFAWWLENIYSQSEDTEAIQDVKLEYWKARTRRENVLADIAEGESIKKGDFMDSWAWRVAEVSAGLAAIAQRVAPLVAKKTAAECRKILDKEMWEIRDKFARTGKFTPKGKK